jgi:hypothetical protein
MDYFNCEKIHYEGPDSKNPFAFKHYDPESTIAGKSMREHLRFAAPYWHVMRNELSDPFGPGTAQMPWDDGSSSVENALQRVDVFFEFLEKMGIDFYCWHDRDIAPELNNLAASNEALDLLLAKLQSKCDLATIAAISGAAQQHGSVYLNEKWPDALGQLGPSSSLSDQIAPCLTRSTAPIWMDGSTGTECREISEALGGHDVVCAKSGSVAIERFNASSMDRSPAKP